MPCTACSDLRALSPLSFVCLQGELEKLEEQNRELRTQLKDLAEALVWSQKELKDTKSEVKTTQRYIKAICRTQNIVPLEEE